MGAGVLVQPWVITVGAAVALAALGALWKLARSLARTEARLDAALEALAQESKARKDAERTMAQEAATSATFGEVRVRIEAGDKALSDRVGELVDRIGRLEDRRPR